MLNNSYSQHCNYTINSCVPADYYSPQKVTKKSQKLHWSFDQDILDSNICSILVKSYKQQIENTQETISHVTQQINDFIPKTYRGLNVIQVQDNDWSVLEVNSSPKSKLETIYDKYGNVSFLTLYIFLNNSVTNNSSLNSNRFIGGENIWFSPRHLELPSIKGSAVLFDHEYEVQMNPVSYGQKFILAVKIKYDTATNYIGNDYDKIIYRKSLLPKPFLNSYSLFAYKLSKGFEYAYDIGYEQCQCCDSWIPVESEYCEHCTDRLMQDAKEIKKRIIATYL